MLKLAWNATLVTVGLASIAIGIAGVIIPFFPGTPFLLLAIGCFATGWLTCNV